MNDPYVVTEPLKPYVAKSMRSYPVSTRIKRRANDDEALDSRGGFSFLLAGLKALLEHKVALNLVGDHCPIRTATALSSQAPPMRRRKAN